MAAKILYLQAVFLLNLLQDYVYALNGEDRTFLADQNRGFQSDWFDVSVTFPYMLLQLRIQPKCPLLACLLPVPSERNF